MTKDRWRYVQRHVEMRDNEDMLLEAIRQPDYQEPDPRAGRERYWRAVGRPSRSAGCEWL